MIDSGMHSHAGAWERGNNLVQNLTALKTLPSSWSIAPFDEAVKDYSAGNKKILKSDFLNDGKFAIVDQGQNKFAGFTNDENLLVQSEAPYIIFGDHTRIFKYIDVPFAMGADGTKVLKPKDEQKIDSKYLYYFFLTLNIPNTGYNRHFKHLKKAKIPLPPLAEQQKIAAILDAADRLRQKDAQLIAKYNELSQSLFLDIFGDPVTNPMGWAVESFDYFAKIDTKMTADFDKYADVPHIGIANIEKETGKIVDYNLVRDENLSSGKYIFTPEHIIYSKIRPNLNKVALPTFAGLTSADSYPILVHPNKANRLFFAYILRSFSFVDFILKHSNRTNIPKANKAQMRLYKGIAPPITLQNQFAERIQHVEAQKQQAQAALQKSDDLFHSLLQRAFKGELTAQREHCHEYEK